MPLHFADPRSASTYIAALTPPTPDPQLPGTHACRAIERCRGRFTLQHAHAHDVPAPLRLLRGPHRGDLQAIVAAQDNGERRREAPCGQRPCGEMRAARHLPHPRLRTLGAAEARTRGRRRTAGRVFEITASATRCPCGEHVASSAPRCEASLRSLATHASNPPHIVNGWMPARSPGTRATSRPRTPPLRAALVRPPGTLPAPQPLATRRAARFGSSARLRATWIRHVKTHARSHILFGPTGRQTLQLTWVKLHRSAQPLNRPAARPPNLMLSHVEFGHASANGVRNCEYTPTHARARTGTRMRKRKRVHTNLTKRPCVRGQTFEEGRSGSSFIACLKLLEGKPCVGDRELAGFAEVVLRAHPRPLGSPRSGHGAGDALPDVPLLLPRRTPSCHGA